MDTVPPFIPSSEDTARVYGRGSCDAKGIIAIQVEAAERLHRDGIHVGLLFLVGEERDSLGARRANQNPPDSKFLVNGEPTENRIALASKGALRVEVVARGRMAHSAYPELGESAIDKLLLALARLHEMKLPAEEGIGPSSSYNIGVIEGGRAPNIIPDKARAQLLYRLVGSSEQLKRDIVAAVGDLAKIEFVLEIPCVRLQHSRRPPYHGRRVSPRTSPRSAIGGSLCWSGPDRSTSPTPAANMSTRNSCRRRWICIVRLRGSWKSSHPRHVFTDS